MRLAILSFLLLTTLAAGCRAAPAGSPVRATTTRHVGVVTRAGARFALTVEIAESPEARQKGLMFRRTLGADEGMLFVFGEDRVESFWMHNTLIPLDMLFVRADGTIAGIVANAQPQTDTPRSVGLPSRYVLEVNGGWCALHGVAAGDRLELGDAVVPPR